MGGEFFEGPASYLIGGNLLVRWNFVQGPNPKWVPYIQIGGGSLYHDADTDAQDILGSNIEAMAVGGLGLRYHLNENGRSSRRSPIVIFPTPARRNATAG